MLRHGVALTIIAWRLSKFPAPMGHLRLMKKARAPAKLTVLGTAQTARHAATRRISN